MIMIIDKPIALPPNPRREIFHTTRVNVLAGQLGCWYCGACKPPSSHCRLKAPGLDSRTKCNRAMRTGFARLCQAL